MPDSRSLEHLLRCWEQDRTPPEELCRECPDLLPDLRRLIAGRQETISLDSPVVADDSTHPDHVAELMAFWRQRQEEGRSISPEELCRDHLVLLPEIRRRIASLETRTPPQEGVDTPDFSLASGITPVDPQSIGRYQLKKRLGQGGFGEVWQAFDPELQRDVAVKMPRADRVFSDQQIDEFLSEARRVASLKHSGLVPVYDVGRQGRAWFIVSEFIDGPSLSGRLAEGRLSQDQAVRAVVEVADALHYAHLRGFVHRDVKPGNILMNRDGTCFLTDFGLATTEDDQLSLGYGVAGTLLYMSPEQARGESRHLDGRSDIYSLGVVLYELLTGRRPFKVVNLTDYLDQIQNREVRPLRSIDDRISSELERITLKCLSKSVIERYTTAGDVAADLRRWLDSTESPAVQPIASRKRYATILGSVVGVILLVGLVLGGKSLLDRAAPSAEPDRNPFVSVPGTQPDRQVVDTDQGHIVTGLRSLNDCRPLRWYDLLDREPTVDLWTAGDGLARWDHDAGLEQLSLSLANRGGMLAFGAVKADGYTLQVNIAQGHWTGGMGIYFGYREEDIPEPPEGVGKVLAEYQFIEFSALHEEKAGQFCLVRGRGVIRYSKLGNGWVRRPSSLSLAASRPLPELRNEQPLEIAIENGRLAHVRVGVADFPELTAPVINAKFTSEDYHGRLGAISYGASCFYRNARFMVHAPVGR